MQLWWHSQLLSCDSAERSQRRVTTALLRWGVKPVTPAQRWGLPATSHQPFSSVLASLFLCYFRQEMPHLPLMMHLNPSTPPYLPPSEYVVGALPQCLLWGNNSETVLWRRFQRFHGDTVKQSKALSSIAAQGTFLAFFPYTLPSMVTLTSFAFCSIHYSCRHLQ